MPIQLTCQLCDTALPPIDDESDEGKEQMRLLLKGGVELKHGPGLCPVGPNSSGAAGLPAGVEIVTKTYRCDVRLVEVIPGDEGGDVTLEELASFRVEADAGNFGAALRPLAEKLGERWMQTEEFALIAEVPPS